MTEKKKYPVTILRRRTTKQAKGLNKWVSVIRVTYVAEGLAPRTIRILEEEYSEDKEKELIRKDIEKRLTEKPESYSV